ncbi:hypothetical protein ABTK38_21685, partial [Acinetobacter baumannii]
SQRYLLSAAALAALCLFGQAPLHAATPAATPAAKQHASQELPTAQPEAVGVDSRKLIELSQWIRRDQLDVRSLLVIKDGKLIFERY